MTSVDPTNNWLFGLAIDQRTSPTIDTTIEHTYGGSRRRRSPPRSRTAAASARARSPMRTSTTRTTATASRRRSTSRRFQQLAGVERAADRLCPQNGPCNFQVPVSDNEGHAVTYPAGDRASKCTRQLRGRRPGGLGEPGQGMSCADATIGSATGLYAWNTTMCRLAGSPGPNPPAGGLQQCQPAHPLLDAGDHRRDRAARSPRPASTFSSSWCRRAPQHPRADVPAADAAVRLGAVGQPRPARSPSPSAPTTSTPATPSP